MEAEDLTREILWRIYYNLKSFDAKRPFKPWGFKVAVNVCLTYSVQSSRLRPAESAGFGGQTKFKNKEGEDDQEVEFKDEKVDLVKETERNEVSERVQAALMKLPAKYRLALYLHYFEGLKYEEIAEDINLPVNTVRTHIKRGKEKMKQELEDLI